MIRTVGVLALSALLVFVPATSSASTDDSGFAVVSPALGSGWQMRQTGASTVGFVWGPSGPWSGSGSAELRVAAGASGAELRNAGYDGTYLYQLTELTYVTYVERNRSGEVVYVVLDVDYDQDDVADDVLYFEPVYQNADSFPSYPQDAPQVGTWQWWDALNGGWWSREGTADAGPGIDVKSIWDIIAKHPAARIVNAAPFGGVRLVAGYGAPGNWSGFVGNVDSISIGVDGESTYFDFEIDRDADGFADGEDAVPQSDLRSKVDVNGAEPGATLLVNTLDATGRTLQDRVHQCAAAAPDHGQYVKGIQGLLLELQCEGGITPEEARAIRTAASRSSVGTTPR